MNIIEDLERVWFLLNKLEDETKTEEEWQEIKETKKIIENIQKANK
jgi:hypothetical protein